MSGIIVAVDRQRKKKRQHPKQQPRKGNCPLRLLPLSSLRLRLRLRARSKTASTKGEDVRDARLHPLHRLLAHLLLLLRHLPDPLLAILPDLLVHGLIRLLAPLPHLVLERFALLEALGQAVLHAVYAATLRLGAQDVAEEAHGAFGPLGSRFGVLLLELFSDFGFAPGKFAGDMRPLEGLDDLPCIAGVESSNEF